MNTRGRGSPKEVLSPFFFSKNGRVLLRADECYGKNSEEEGRWGQARKKRGEWT